MLCLLQIDKKSHIKLVRFFFQKILCFIQKTFITFAAYFLTKNTQ